MLSPRATTWELDWWIGADDRWHVPAREAAVRQQLIDGMPVVQTAMRVPGGDAVQRVYGAPAGDVGEVAVVEIANESPAPFVVALVVRGASALDLDGASVWADGRSAIRTPRPPSRWAASVDGSTEDTVASGAASDGPFAHRQDRGARLVGAFLYPIAHRTTLACRREHGDAGDRRGRSRRTARRRRRWRAGGRSSSTAACGSSCPTSRCSARSTPLGPRRCWPARRGGSIPTVAAVLEDWGLDAEAAVAWSRLTGRARRRLARREPGRATWTEVLARAARPDAQLLAALRAVLVREHDASVVDARRLAAGVDRPADRRARRTDPARAGVVLGAVARRATGVAVGGSGGHHVHGTRARPRLVVDRGRAARRCSRRSLRH